MIADIAIMTELQETAAKHTLIAKDHCNIAQDSLKFHQTVREQELSDRQKECLELFRFRKSTQEDRVL